jgi:hypothetical protein
MPCPELTHRTLYLRCRATDSVLPATYFMFVALSMGFVAADNVWARLPHIRVKPPSTIAKIVNRELCAHTNELRLNSPVTRKT